MSTKPALVLVPGLCSLGTVVFKPLLDLLKSDKYGFADVEALDLPSCDAIATQVSLDPSALHVDISAVRTTIEGFLARGRDVVVVGHSYGGTPAVYACDGLWKKSQSPREREGGEEESELQQQDKPGVLRVILLCASLTLPGGTVGGDREEYMKQTHSGAMNNENPTIEKHGEEYFILPNASLAQTWLNDIPDPTTLAASALRPSPLSTVMTPTPTDIDVTAWRIAYLLCPGDLAMPEAFSTYLIERAQGHGVDVQAVKSVASGHFVQISHVAEVAEWISEIAR